MNCFNKKQLCLALIVVSALSMLAAAPEVSNVTMQQIEHSRNVRITYDLAVTNAIITLAIETNGVALPDSAVVTLSGDVNCEVSAGTAGEIIWQAGRDWPENQADNVRARITAWSKANPPQVMVLDLSGGTAATNYPVSYYPHVDSLEDGISSTIYKNDNIVLKRIPAGYFTMGEGSGTKDVTLTKDFYIGVYQVTQGQWFNVMGDTREANFTDASSKSFRPMEQVSYHDIREDPGTNEPIDPNWPATNAVGETSFMGVLRDKTKINGFDLPTEAQWEYACRAGTTSYYNDGNGDAPNDGVSVSATTSNTFIDVLGRYRYNGGYKDGGATKPESSCGPTNGTAIVGTYLPNAWGLYDMHGNVYEWCLDWYGTPLQGGSDPVGVGAASGSVRVMRGGSWRYTASFCRSAFRDSHAPSSRDYIIGFRLLRTLP